MFECNFGTVAPSFTLEPVRRVHAAHHSPLTQDTLAYFVDGNNQRYCLSFQTAAGCQEIITRATQLAANPDGSTLKDGDTAHLIETGDEAADIALATGSNTQPLLDMLD